MAIILIDEIKPQKGHLTGLYAEGEWIVSLDSDLAAEKGLKAGREYSVDELQALLSESQRRRAKSKALYLLEYRDYSAHDITLRLKKDFEEPAALAAVDYLVEIGAIDDARYAENMIRHLITQKHYGRRRILQELAAKGIDRDTAEEALDTFDNDEPSAIMELLEKRFSRDLTDDKGIRRTVATLQRYGYDSSDIWDALRDYKDSPEET